MLEFMDYIQRSFLSSSNWNEENSYSNLTATSRALLDFPIPHGLRFNVSSLASPNFATSYSLNTVGLVDGSLSYLFSSLPLHPRSQSGNLDLHDLIRGYRQIQEYQHQPQTYLVQHESASSNVPTAFKSPVLLYGRLYLPQSFLEALYLRRLTPKQQLRLAAVSSSRLRNGGTILAVHQYDTGKFSTETLYSSDGGLLGVKGLYNFGPDPRHSSPDSSSIPPPTSATSTSSTTSTPSRADDRFYGRFSAGAEAYYGTLNKSGGVSLGGRFATLPSHKGIPLTATLTLNPLMGNFSASYAVKAGSNLALSSRFDFNAYSYESGLVLGLELWRMRRKEVGVVRWPERSWEARLEWRLDPPVVVVEEEKVEEEVAGVLKARIDERFRIGVVWEGRVKELLFSLGSTFDMKRRDQPFRTLGLEVQYSS